MKPTHNLAAFTLLGVLAASVAYQQVFIRNSSPSMADLEFRRAELLFNMEQMTVDRLQLERLIEDTQARLGRSAGTLAALAAEAEAARFRMEPPDFDKLKERALKDLQQSAPNQPVSLAQLPMAALRESNPEPYERMAMTRARAQYSAHLDALGITGPRREDILQTIGETLALNELMGARRSEGLITQEEYDAHMEAHSLDALALRLFSEEEHEVVQGVEQERIVQVSVNNFRTDISFAAPQLSSETNQLAAETVQRHVGTSISPPSDRVDVIALRMRAFQTAQSELATQLDPVEQRQLQAYFDRQLINLERQARAAERQEQRQELEQR